MAEQRNILRRYQPFEATEYDPNAPQPTTAETFNLTVSPEADLRRGFESSTLGLQAGSLYHQADQLEVEGRVQDATALREVARGKEELAGGIRQRVGSFQDVQNINDAIDFLQGGFGQLLPTMGPPMAAGLAGAVGGAALAGPLGIAPGIAAGIGGAGAASIPAFQMEAGEQASSQQHDPFIRENTTAEERLREQNIKGAQNAALESLFPAVFGGRIVGRAASRIAGEALAKSPLRRTLAVAREGSIEAGTELSQTLTGQASLSRLNPNRDTSQDYVEQIDSLILGALGGTSISLGTTVPGYLAERTGQKLGQKADTGARDLGRAVGELQLRTIQEMANRGQAVGVDVPLRPSMMISNELLEEADRAEFQELARRYQQAITAGDEARVEGVVREAQQFFYNKHPEWKVIQEGIMSREAIQQGEGANTLRLSETTREPTPENPDINMLPDQPVAMFPEVGTAGTAKFQRRHILKGGEKAQLLKWKNQGFISDTGMDSAQSVPLGQWLEERNASPEEVQAEADTMLRDINRRLRGNNSPENQAKLEAQKSALEGAKTYGQLFDQLNEYSVLQFPPSEVEGRFTPQDADMQRRSLELVTGNTIAEKRKNREQLKADEGIRVKLRVGGHKDGRWVIKRDIIAHALDFFREELRSFPDGPAREEAALLMGVFSDPRVTAILHDGKEITQEDANLENPVHRAALKLDRPKRGYKFGKKPQDPLYSRAPEDNADERTSVEEEQTMRRFPVKGGRLGLPEDTTPEPPDVSPPAPQGATGNPFDTPEAKQRAAQVQRLQAARVVLQEERKKAAAEGRESTMTFQQALEQVPIQPVEPTSAAGVEEAQRALREQRANEVRLGEEFTEFDYDPMQEDIIQLQDLTARRLRAEERLDAATPNTREYWRADKEVNDLTKQLIRWYDDYGASLRPPGYHAVGDKSEPITQSPLTVPRGTRDLTPRRPKAPPVRGEQAPQTQSVPRGTSKTASGNVVVKNGVAAAKAYANADLQNRVYTLRQFGRAHFGNPFTHLPINRTQGTVMQVGSVAEAVQAYRDWLTTTKYDGQFGPQLDARKKWILEQLPKLKGKELVYYKELNEPSHANVLDELIQSSDPTANGGIEQKGIKPSYQTRSKLATDIIYARLAKNLREKGLKIVEENGEFWVVDKDGKRLSPEEDKNKKTLNDIPLDLRYDTLEEALQDPDIQVRKNAATTWLVRAFGPEIVDNLGWMLAREAPGLPMSGYYDTFNDFISLAVDSLDPLGAAFHEGMHKFVKRLGDSGNQDLYNRMVKAATAPHVMKQMEKLLADYPMAIEQMRQDPEEAVAYAFQFYAASRLPGGPEFRIQPSLKEFFTKLVESIKRMLGVMTHAKASQEIFDALYEGRVQRDGIEPLRKYQERSFKGYAKDVMDGVRRAVPRALSSPIIQLHNQRNANGDPIQAFKTLADAWHSQPLKGGPTGLVYRNYQLEGQYRNRWHKILADNNVTKEDMQSALTNFQSMRPPRNQFERQLQHFFRQMYAYQFERGENPVKVLKVIDEETGQKDWVKPDRVENYWPRIWSAEEILANEIEFREVMREEGNLTDEQITNFIEMLQATNGLEAGSELQQYRAEFSPFNAAINARVFDFINEGNAHRFAKFQEQNMAKVMDRYIRQAVHRREHSRTFGHDGRVVKNLMQQAKLEGATEQQLEYAEKVVKGLEGRLGTDKVSDFQREAMVASMSITNFAVLAMATLSSMVDPLGVMVRTGSVKAAANTFKTGFKQIINDARKTKTSDQELTEYLGIIEEDMVQDMLNNMERGIYMNEKLRKINKFFFKSIGLEQWTRGTRIGAMRASLEYMKKYKNDAQRMEELGLESGLIQEFEDRIKLKPEEFNPENPGDPEAIEKARKVQNAVFRMVDESILRPSAATRPLWASDMRFRLLGHLKSYTFTFHNQILRQLGTRAANADNWAQSALVFMPLLSYVPVMLAADMARDMIQGDDKDRDWDEILGRALQRSAILGMGTFVMDIEDEMDWGGLPTNTVLGPVIDNTLNLGRTAVNPDASFTNAAAKLLPYNALWRKWGDDE